MGMHVFLHTKPGVPAGSQIGYGSFVLFVDGESPDTWVLPALQRGDSPARASDAKVARPICRWHRLILGSQKNYFCLAGTFQTRTLKPVL